MLYSILRLSAGDVALCSRVYRLSVFVVEAAKETICTASKIASRHVAIFFNGAIVDVLMYKECTCKYRNKSRMYEESSYSFHAVFAVFAG